MKRLETNGSWYEMVCANRPAEIMAWLVARNFDVYVVDSETTGDSAEGVCRTIRAVDKDGAVICLSPNGEERGPLLDAGADPDEKLGHDNTALISAVSENPDERAGVVRSLLDAGADVNGRGISGVTALHTAAASGRLDIVELLLESGADIAAMDDNGNTPALTAAEAGQIKAVSFLAERGADLDHKNKQGSTAREVLGEMMLWLKSP